ncbi:MAG TPA: riboflavin synthase [Nitrosomonas sp.]|nr:riboflavin synthase [Nitrosomonas sp.]HQX12710.1 riboflavin synthase [Nitrosomonas sp.]HRB20496.1 riboflavin synthase [Nitrosomonas sp.]HRB32317.1 riboflavin synthase [Nitrosomonas sp.]HRB44979.1 riboflavin synthase [Nitrosomonas sp.]
MFTGIVQAIGKIVSTDISHTTPQRNLSLRLEPGNLDLSDINLGDSVAVDGICLTVKSLVDRQLHFDVSEETLLCTHGLDKINKPVNLEKALRLSDRLGGHLVSGHIDAIGTVVKWEPTGENTTLEVDAPSAILRYLTHKGSITVDGVSLTINQIIGNTFSVNLIPHTIAVTTLGQLQVGSLVNLESDMLARYVARLLNIEK